MIRQMLLATVALLGTFLCLANNSVAAADWKPADGPLMTRWAKDVSPDNVHGEYPRPQMVREDWVNLNGLWDYAIRPKDAAQPEQFDGEILVPFAAESALSGVMKAVGPDNRLWYRRTFTVPESAKNDRLLLHFQAVDWHAQVWINGEMVGEHKGGYDPFTFDIGGALHEGGEQEIVVGVWDPTNNGPQPRGKQVLEPKGIWYTAVTGIWQTVWLEPVPATSIHSLKIVPDIDSGQVVVTVLPAGTRRQLDVDIKVTSASLRDETHAINSIGVKGKPGQPIAVEIPDARLWSPDEPWLYQMQVNLAADGQAVDSVASYFGMRKSEVKKDDAGINRLFLNDKALFQIGPLDQGWWPDGLYTAATDEALLYDVEITRQLGYNMARKHVKVEPERWYYHCDRMGLMVWQDMPSGGGAGELIGDGKTFPRSQFERELKSVIDSRHNFPCIVMWVPFNEGWGQHETESIAGWLQEYDPTRPVNESSGWTDKGSGDVKDIHSYPGPAMPPIEEKRAGVLGEFGGLGLPIKGHLWWDKRNWGYRNLQAIEELRSSYDQLIKKLHPMIGRGMAAAVYTQTSDCEGEVNGLMTYDRDVVKFDVDHMAKLHAKLYLPPPIIITKVIVPTSQDQPRTWKYTTEKPADGWETSNFDDSAWKSGPGGFGAKDTPGTIVRTTWNTADIWLRQDFELAGAAAPNLHLRVHHDEDAEVFVNGKKVASLTGYVTEYFDLELSPEARKAFRAGTNTVAVHCRQTRGGQYIDVGLVEITEKARGETK